MPVQKPGKSKQDYGTPWELIHAVEKRWGQIQVDLAARADSAKAPFCYTPEQDSLAQDWSALTAYRCWLNPPFERIDLWAAKCKLEAKRGAKIIMLTPASVGSEWFAEHVFGIARVVALRPRITFEGCTDPYPKDCMLSLFGLDTPGFEIWRYR